MPDNLACVQANGKSAEIISNIMQLLESRQLGTTPASNVGSKGVYTACIYFWTCCVQVNVYRGADGEIELDVLLTCQIQHLKPKIGI